MGVYLNDFTKKPMTAAQYTMMRGVTDFTNAEQLNMYEGGHSMIVIINKPKFLEVLAENDKDVDNLLQNFCNIVEYEFKGLSGIEDITSETLEFNDGISQLQTVGKVNEQSASQISMTYTEKSGSTITKFIKYYLQGVRDSRTQVKHYHGLIAEGKLALGFENEVFNLLYLVTDASGLSLEAAYLLANAWPGTAATNIYNNDRASIEIKEIEITWNCVVIQNEEINRRAVKMLAHINQDNAVYNANSKNGSSDEAAALAASVSTYDDYQINWDSQKYDYTGLNKIDKIYGNT